MAITAVNRLPEPSEAAFSRGRTQDWRAGSQTTGRLRVDVVAASGAEKESAESLRGDYLLSYTQRFNLLSAEDERELAWRIWRARSELAENLGVIRDGGASNSISNSPRTESSSTRPSSLDVDRLLLAQELAKYWLTQSELRQEAYSIHAEFPGCQFDTEQWTRQRSERIATVRRCLDDAREAEETLVRHNLRLVFWIARRYAGKGFEMADVVQYGCLGLIHAAARFDPTRGTRFSTVATTWIIQSIQRGLANTARLIRVPVNRIGLLRKISDTNEKLRSRLGRVPSADEIANELGVGVETVTALMAAMEPVASLEATVAATDLRVEELIEARAGSPLDAAIEAERERKVNAALSTLSSRERDIVAMRFGIGYERNHSFQEIGAVLGISRERVRQLLNRILESLRRVHSLRELHAGGDP